MGSDGMIPIGEVLPGAKIHPLEKDCVFVSAFVLVKFLDEDGDLSWGFRTTEQPNDEELYGALSIQTERLRRSLLSDWEGDD